VGERESSTTEKPTSRVGDISQGGRGDHLFREKRRLRKIRKTWRSHGGWKVSTIYKGKQKRV